MRVGARAAAACLLAAAAAPAAAWVRSDTCPGDPNAGYALWWAGAPPVLSFRLSTAHVPVGCAPPGCNTASCGGDFPTLEALVKASVDAWAQARTASTDPTPCTGLTTAYQGAQADAVAGIQVGVEDGQDLIVFRRSTCAELLPAGTPCLTQGGCGNLYNCWEEAASTSTLALTVVTFRTGNGQILDADTELWDWNGSTSRPTGHYFTCASPPATACTGPGFGQEGCIEWDVGSVVTHETGHMIGLDHQTAVPSVMAPTLSAGSVAQRKLEADDVGAVCTIYPPGQPALQQKLPGSCGSSARTGGCGCSGGPAGLPGLLVLPFLRRRRGRGIAFADRLG